MSHETRTDSSAPFVGTWMLHSIESKGESGQWRVSERLGPNPLGILIYDINGNVAAQLARRDRSIPDPADSPADSPSAAVNGYIAYFGTYAVDPAAGTVAHYRSAHVNPEMSLLTAIRHYRFDGDTLTLTVAPDRVVRLIWKRQG